MAQAIKIVESKKHGFGGKESYIVTRGQTSYLRIVGNHPDYDLMTATASEDDKSYFVCGNKVKLISSALQFGASMGFPPSYKDDSSGRRFIKICELHLTTGKEDENREEIYSTLGEFFQMYDTSDAASNEVVNEMQGLYSALAHGSHGDDVYLHDGVWLSSDGRLHDRGR